VLAELFPIVAPVYAAIGLGFWWARSGRPFDTALVTELIMTVGAPCLVFSSLTTVALERHALVAMTGASVAAFVVLAVAGAAALRLVRLPALTYLGPIVFMNAGNLGLPLCRFAFGEEGLSLAVAFFAVGAVANFTVGQWLWTGRPALGPLLRTPLAWSAAISAVVLAFEARPPEWLLRTTDLLGEFTIPLMQIALGVSLARIPLSSLPRSAGVSALRIGLGAGVGVALAAAFGLSGTARGVFVLQSAMPAAVFNYLLAERHARSPEDVASVVLVSTLLSFATSPLLLAWLL
jgi:hypothetical protein